MTGLRRLPAAVMVGVIGSLLPALIVVIGVQVAAGERTARQLRANVDRRFGVHVRPGDTLAGDVDDPDAYRRHAVDVCADDIGRLLVGIRAWEYLPGRGFWPRGWVSSPCAFDPDDLTAVVEERARLDGQLAGLDEQSRRMHLAQLRPLTPIDDYDEHAERIVADEASRERVERARQLAAQLTQRPLTRS